MSLKSLDSGIFTLKEFYNRGVIKLAPDVLVYIGGSLTTSVIAPVTGKDSNLSFNDGITNVNVQNNVDPPGSSNATIEITTPIYGEKSKYWVYYKGIDSSSPVRAPIFVPMMEVKIYFKGRFLVQDRPRYYAAFWGFITDVEENFSGGAYKINLTCADILHWWAYSKINVHPVPASNIMVGGGQKLTAFSTIFDRMNPYQILYTLTKNMGMHEFVTVSWPGQKTPLQSIYPTKLFRRVTKGIMSYWQQRFANIGNLLKMYGINGRRVDERGIQKRVPENNVTKKNQMSRIQEAATPKDDQRYSLDIDFIRNFETFADYENMGTFENAEYMTKLDIATTIKSRVDFEFYQDVNGNFIFKPPFYNLNVKGILPYTILPSEIISYSVSQNSEGIVTVMTVYTPMHKNLKTTSYNRGIGFHMDIDLMNRYGVRHHEITMEYVRDESIARTLALGQLSQVNAKTIVGNVTIPGRPEMKLGYPIYMEHRDSFHYVKSINHAFDYAGTFTTTLSLETERRKVYNPDNWNELYKDRVFRIMGPVPEKDKKKTNKQDPPPLFAVEKNEIIEQDFLIGERKIVSVNQGKYAIKKRKTTAELSVTSTTVPYTDADGFQVIGSFPYGRNLNAINVLSTKTNLPVLKEVYLTTMARPVYTNEQKSMEILFFPDEEGAVPSYLNEGDRKLPRILGLEKDLELFKNTELKDTLTGAEKKEDIFKKNNTTNDIIVNVTDMTPENVKTDSPIPKGNSQLVNQV